MPTNTRGSSGWGLQDNYGTTTTAAAGKQNPYPRTRSPHTRQRRRTTTAVPPQYRNVCDTLSWKINSYRTLYNQVRGPAKYGRPTPTVLNNFANWINKGAIVQTCTGAQIAKWARSTNTNFNPRTRSTTACKNVLDAKFGKNVIKAVARTKSGSYMVATSPTWKGKWFNFPK